MMTKNAKAAPHDIAADWLTFTIKKPPFDDKLVAFEAAHSMMLLHFPELKVHHTPDGISRKPYSGALRLGIGGQVMFGESLNHFCVEIHGKGCRNLEERDEFYSVATRAIKMSLNITRFDLAVDFQTDLDPEEFIERRSARYKSTGVMESETGKTCYVGSPKSTKRARVYRYYPPHERAHLMRVEMVMRKPDAQAALRVYLDTSPEECAAQLGNNFEWGHDMWDLSSRDKIKSWRPDRGKASTLRWLRTQVIPALRTLYDDGVLPDNHPVWREFDGLGPLELTDITHDDDDDGEFDGSPVMVPLDL